MAKIQRQNISKVWGISFGNGIIAVFLEKLTAETDGILIFAEVKTRSNNIFGTPAAAVDQKKQTHLWRAAEAFLLDHPWEDEVRFDVVEIYAKLISTGSFQLEKIHHIKNIVLEV